MRLGIQLAPGCIPVSATACGWLRRSDLDAPGIQAWEMPDGKIRIEPAGPEPMLVKVDVATLRDLDAREANGPSPAG